MCSDLYVECSLALCSQVDAPLTMKHLLMNELFILGRCHAPKRYDILLGGFSLSTPCQGTQVPRGVCLWYSDPQPTSKKSWRPVFIHCPLAVPTTAPQLMRPACTCSRQ